MIRRSLTVVLAFVLIVLLGGTTWLLNTEAGLQYAFQVLQHQTGGKLRVAQSGGTLGGMIVLQDVAYQDGELRVHSDSMRLRVSAASILSGRLIIRTLELAGLTINLPSQAAAGDDDNDALPDFGLPVTITLAKLAIDGMTLDRGEQHHRIDSIAASLTAGPRGIDIRQAEVHAERLQLKMKGEIGTTGLLQHALHTDWQVRLQSGDVLVGTGSVQGNLDNMQIKQRLLQPSAVVLEGSVSSLLDTPEWQASVNLDALERTDWRYQIPVTGASLQFDVRGDAGMTSLHGKGSVSHEQTGLLHTDYQLELHDLERLEIVALELRPSQTDGMIMARGTVNLKPYASWQASVEGSGINPVSLHPDWPGRLDFSAHSSGSMTENGFSSRVEIRQLNGALRELPVKLVGDLDWRRSEGEDVVDLRRFIFSSGQSSLNAKGRMEKTLALDWTVQSPDLSELIPGAQGRLDASGSLLGSLQQPRLAANIDGQALAYQHFRAAAVKGTVEFAPDVLQNTRVDISAESLSLQDQYVDRVQISGDAGRLVLTAEAGVYRADLAFTGRAVGLNWEGQLQTADLKIGPMQNWKLRQPARLVLQQQAYALDRSCWLGSDSTVACMNINGSAGEWAVNATIDDFALRQLQPWLPAGLALDALADARARFMFSDNRLSGTAALSLPRGEMRYPLRDGVTEQWAFQSGTMELVADDNGIRSQARLELDNDGKLRASVELPGASLPAIDVDRQNISGQVQINFDDLGFVGLWLPEAHRVKGDLAVSMQIGGSLRSPALDGRINLTDASFSLPRLGLDIRELSLTGKSRGHDRFEYQLAALSGEGRLNVEGAATRSDGGVWSSRLKLRGRDLEIVRIPEAQVTASPNLVIDVKPYRIEVEGDVELPYARLEPRDLSTAARASSDVVIIGEDKTADNQWVIVSKIKLRLGERVHFTGYGFEGRLGGEVSFEDTPGQPTRARGEISVNDGRYRAYGQRLDVQKGRLIFSGGPLTSPGLDVTAQRKIGTITVGIHALGTITEPRIELFSRPAMGQTDILSYLILGRPLENASTEEGQMMAKAALALGLSGGDRIARNLRDRFGLDEMRIDSSERDEQASLIIGRYLTPRLYISYGIGLIEAFNTFIVRYQVSQRWQLKAESGESHSTDLIFTIER